MCTAACIEEPATLRHYCWYRLHTRSRHHHRHHVTTVDRRLPWQVLSANGSLFDTAMAVTLRVPSTKSFSVAAEARNLVPANLLRKVLERNTVWWP